MSYYTGIKRVLTCNMLTKYTSFLFNISSMNLISSSLNSRLLLSHEAWKCNPNGARLVEKCRLKLCLSKRPNCSPVWMFEQESTMWQPIITQYIRVEVCELFSKYFSSGFFPPNLVTNLAETRRKLGRHVCPARSWPFPIPDGFG